jgi:hypothetical protein
VACAVSLKAKHNFTTANCLWSNDTIEPACKQVICAFCAVLSELKMYADEWLEVVNMVQSVLNNSPSTRMNKRTPMQVFTGHADTTPLALMLKDTVPVAGPGRRAQRPSALRRVEDSRRALQWTRDVSLVVGRLARFPC